MGTNDVDIGSEIERLMDEQFSRTAATSRPAASVRRVGGTTSSSPPVKPSMMVTSLVGQVIERPTAVGPSNFTRTTPGGAPAPSFPVAKHRTQSAFSLSRHKDKRVGVSSQFPTQSSDADAILASMSPSELQEAKEELLERFSAEQIAFLRRRGREKGTKALADSKAEGTYDYQGDDDAGADALPGQGTIDVAQHDANTPPLVGRIRFGLDGRPVELCANWHINSFQASEQERAVARDPLRSAEGSVPSDGYTIQEAVYLTRSTVHQQRVVGFRILEAVLGNCHEGLTIHESHTTDTGTDTQRGGGNTPLQQRNVVWNYAVTHANVVLAIRAGLDDRNDSVILAASRALEALLLVNDVHNDEMSGWLETADRVTPRYDVLLRYMTRNGKGFGPNQWVAFPVDLEPSMNERDIAKVDPSIGIILMRLFDRIAFLLSRINTNHQAESESQHLINASLIRILCFVARLGPDVCEKVASTPGLMPCLLNQLPGDSATTKTPEVLVQLLTAIKLLCRSSTKISETVISQGTKTLLNTLALHSVMPESEAIVAECLGIWRAIVEGSSGSKEELFASFEDYFPVLERFLCPTLKDKTLIGSHKTFCTVELYLLMAALRSKSLLGAAAARAVFSSTVEWLAGYEDEIVEVISNVDINADANGDASVGRLSNRNVLFIVAAAMGFVCEIDKQDGGAGHSTILCRPLLSGKIRSAVETFLPCSFSNPALFPIMASLAHRLKVSMRYTNNESRILSFANVSVIHPGDAFYVYYTLLYYRCCFSMLSFDTNVVPQQVPEDPRTPSSRDVLGILTRLPPGGEDVAMSLMTVLFQQHGTAPLERGRECVRDYLARKNLVEPNDDMKVVDQVEAMFKGHRPSADCNELLHGYASTWRLGDQNPVGSYLPLPETWTVCRAVPLSPYDAALQFLWVLGMVDLGHLIPTVLHVQTAIDLVYLQGSSDDSGDFYLWREDVVRYTVGALVDACLLVHAELAATSTNEEDQIWTMHQAQQLVSDFASVSYGDWVFGAAVATLLLPCCASLDVQLEALTLLTDERALHLLPTADRCFGKQQDYFGHLDLSSTSDVMAQQEVYLKILGTQEFVEAVDRGTVGGLVIVHRLAWMMFMNEDEKLGEGLGVRAAGRLKTLGPLGRQALEVLLAWNPEDGCSYPSIPPGRRDFRSLLDTT